MSNARVSVEKTGSEFEEYRIFGRKQVVRVGEQLGRVGDVRRGEGARRGRGTRPRKMAPRR